MKLFQLYPQSSPNVAPTCFEGRDIVLGSYLTSSKDPQIKTQHHPDALEYVERWLSSAARCGLHTVLLVNKASESFQDGIRAIFAKASTGYGSLYCAEVTPRGFTPNDERFLHALELLRVFPCDKVFLTDVGDLFFGRDPFALLENREPEDFIDPTALTRCTSPTEVRRWGLRATWQVRHRKGFRYFLGHEPGTIRENPWLCRQYERLQGRVPAKLGSRPVLNCGILGGDRADIIPLLERFEEELTALNQRERACDMVLFNSLLREHDEKQLFSGGLLSSPWKEYLRQGPWYIFHK